MSSFPEKGMTFEQARSRLMKYNTAMSNPNIANGLIEQAVAHEGESAGYELANEFARTRLDTNNHGSPRLGSSPAYVKNYDAIFGKKNKK